MDERLLKQIRLLKQCLEILVSIRQQNLEAYLSDRILSGAAERYLQLSIESCINIGNRILSLEQMNHNIKVPETYAEIFDLLAEINMIDKDFSENLKNMAKFRNRLVHAYWEVDSVYLYNLLHTHLDDLEHFMAVGTRYVKKQE